MSMERKTNGSVKSFCGLPSEVEIDRENEWKVTRAGQKIQNCFALLALRRQLTENKDLKLNIKIISEKVNALQFQKYALSQLLDAEKIRLSIMNNDMHKVMNIIEDYRQEKNLLIKKNEQLEERIQVLERKLVQMENDCRNYKNDLITVKSDARSWEKQLSVEREKMSRIVDEKKQYIEVKN